MDTWKPMMADKEIEIIDKILDDKRPKRCLEWGSGNSTVYFASKHPEIERWIAIEHNKTYLELLSERLPKNAEIMVIENSDSYIHEPQSMEKFDFILVDGQLRDECLEVAFNITNKGAIILLHDAGRQESALMMKKYKDRITILCDGELMQKNGFYAHRGLALIEI